jgi:sigma-B regulation protein RsbU (phosphoserine phosphatase)
MTSRQELTQNGAATSVDKTLEREIQLAKKIQYKLLNGKKPTMLSGEISGLSVPARNIGGDYFDFYPLQDGRIRIIIGDVMGKGIPAAMLMILARGAFRSAAEHTANPSETLTAMNNALYDDFRQLGSFVTVLCADWDPISMKLTYASAGHSLPIIVRATKELADLPTAKGIMLGGLSKQTYPQSEMVLAKEDLVFFYTDGIVEAQNSGKDAYRLERLQRLLVEASSRQAADIERIVVDDIHAFTEGMAQKDDITMVVLKV